MIVELSGEFVKIAYEDQIEKLLKIDSPDRPAARYNRPGENALYLSRDEKGARVAMQKYVKPTDDARVLVRYRVNKCLVLDLRRPDASELLALSREEWKEALQNGRQPASWDVADCVRESQAVGLIDPSRKDVNYWHVTLFQWNDAGGPGITMVDAPVPIVF